MAQVLPNRKTPDLQYLGAIYDTLSTTGSVVTIADGADIALGAKADAVATDAGSWTVISLLKGIFTGIVGGIAGSLGALSRFRSLVVGNTAVVIKASAGRIYTWRVTNLTASIIYIKIYNEAAATVDPATDLPIMTLPVPPGVGSFIFDELSKGEYCSAAISIRCVTESGDTGTTAPATTPIIEIGYI